MSGKEEDNITNGVLSEDNEIPTFYIEDSDRDEDELSVWTIDTQETNLSRLTETKTIANLPTAIDAHVDRSNIFKRQKEVLRPFELSTSSNGHLLSKLSDNDLLQSIIEIWIRTQLHNESNRLSNLAWYNWVLLDISRRIYEVYSRDNGDPLMVSLIETLASRVYFQTVSNQLIQDGIPFVHYPLFCAERISRLIKLGAKFTDAICAASEFIDFMFILKMEKDEFADFYNQMLASKHILNERFKLIRGPFHSSNPLGPFKPARFAG